jgi:hypothetical protein
MQVDNYYFVRIFSLLRLGLLLSNMAYKPLKIKPGMGGSRGGKSRSEKTEVLKEQSKTLRRREDKKLIIEEQ